MAEEEQGKTLREEISDVYDSYTEESGEESDVKTEENSEEVEEVSAEDTSEDSPVGDDRSEEDVSEEPEEDGEVSSEDEDGEPVKDEQEDEELEPLKHWHKEDKEVFKTLPNEAKEFLLRRDKEFQASATRKQMEVADIKKAFEPVRDQLVKNGVSEADAIRRLLGAHIQLTENPEKAIPWLMQQYGVDPSVILGTEERGSDSDGNAALRSEIQSLKKRLEDYEGRTQQERVSTLTHQIQKFAETHEFFDDVEGEMAMIAQSFVSQGKPAPSLEELYEKACRMNDSVWQRLSKKKEQEMLKKTSDEARENISKSRRAAKATVKPSRKTSGKVPEKKEKTLREDLSEVFDKITQAR